MFIRGSTMRRGMSLIEHTPKRWAEFVKTSKPIIESIVPIDSRRYRDWSQMSSDWLVAHARWAISDRRFDCRTEFQRAESGLYQNLKKRKLLDEIGLEIVRRKQRSWAAMSEEELVSFAKGFIAESGVEESRELKKEDTGLYEALRKRKLLGKIGLEKKRRNWAAITDEKLVAYAKDFISENEMEGKEELKKADMGLYRALVRRNLLDRLGLEEKLREWSVMGDEELVSFTKEFTAENGITGRKELRVVDHGLYEALRKRKLLGKIGLEKRHRNWAAMVDGELVGFAKEFIAENGIGGRSELAKVDSGLYGTLLKRKLLDAAFSDIESSKHAEVVQGVLDALESFGDDP